MISLALWSPATSQKPVLAANEKVPEKGLEPQTTAKPSLICCSPGSGPRSPLPSLLPSRGSCYPGSLGRQAPWGEPPGLPPPSAVAGSRVCAPWRSIPVPCTSWRTAVSPLPAPPSLQHLWDPADITAPCWATFARLWKWLGCYGAAVRSIRGHGWGAGDWRPLEVTAVSLARRTGQTQQLGVIRKLIRIERLPAGV